MGEHISTLEVRKRLGDLLNRVHLRHDRFVIERKGTALAALVPLDTLEAMERLSREALLDVLSRPQGYGPAQLDDAAADALADEAKQASRAKRRE